MPPPLFCMLASDKTGERAYVCDCDILLRHMHAVHCHSYITIESRKYAPPFLHASIRQNSGEGLCV